MRSSFSSLCRLVFLASSATAIATPVKRATDSTNNGNGLVLSLASLPTVGSADEIAITSTVENTGTKEAKLLKYGSIFDSESPTKSFKIVHNAGSTGGGSEVPFQGTRLQLSNDLPDEAFITIPPGGKVTNTHSNLNGIYDFSALGPGTYQFEVIQPTYTQSQSQSDSSSNSNSTSTSDSSPLQKFNFEYSATIEVEVTGNTTRRDLTQTEAFKRDSLVCSNEIASAQIKASFTEALAMAALSVQYIQSYGASEGLFRAYFGAQTTDVPLTVLNRVANENSNRQFFCSDPIGHCGNGVIAYTLVATGDIYFCSPFYGEVNYERLCTDTSIADRNIRGGTTLHELTHATSDTEDYGYGCAADITMAANDPARAAMNADNYNCFATSVYYATQCTAN